MHCGQFYLIRVGGFFSHNGIVQMAIGCAAAPPRCAADFNGSGVFSVQNIFDFLTAYFTGSP